MRPETLIFGPDTTERFDIDDESKGEEPEDLVGVIPKRPREPLSVEHRPQGIWEKPAAAVSQEAARIPEKKSLTDLVSKAKTIEDIYQAVDADTGKQVTNFVEFFEKNVDSLLISVLTNQKGDDNNDLAKLLEAIPKDFDLQKKVKDLMELKWHKHFQENKEELVKTAVLSANSLASLYSVLDHFKSRGQSKKIIADGKDYEPAEVKAQIQRVDRTLDQLSQQENFLNLETSKIDEQVSFLLGEAVPGHSEIINENSPGEALIYRKAKQLLLEKIKTERLKSKSKELNQPFYRRWAKGISRFLRHQ